MSQLQRDVERAVIDKLVWDLAASLGQAIASCKRAARAITVEAPEMARKQLLDVIQSAQGSLMQAQDQAIQRIRLLEDRLKQE